VFVEFKDYAITNTSYWQTLFFALITIEWYKFHDHRLCDCSHLTKSSFPLEARYKRDSSSIRVHLLFVSSGESEIVTVA
jgi:hypothetical protein